MDTVVVPVSAGARAMFADLLAAKQNADREVAIAWTTFCHTHDEPLTSELLAVAADGLVVKRLKSEDG